MTIHSLMLTGIVLFFGSFFVVVMYTWITVNLHEMKLARTVTQSTPARRPAPEPEPILFDRAA